VRIAVKVMGEVGWRKEGKERKGRRVGGDRAPAAAHASRLEEIEVHASLPGG
jgi:hypothetical protein